MLILIVDDHAFQRNALTSMINQLESHQVIHAGDGHQAMQLINTNAPDIIICDLAMPEMDGLALLRHLSAQQFSGSVILSSAYDSSLLRAAANLVNAFGLNLSGVMPKPSSQQQLQHFFQQHQNRYTHVAPKTSLKVDTSTAALQQALNDGQFISVFQPQIDFNSGECVGFEALCRWQHPTHGLLAPYFFIKQIEQAELMPSLTLAMIAHGVHALNELPSEFSHTIMSINLTPSCLNHSTVNTILANQALMALARRNRIVFEMTEQTQLLSNNLSLELLSRLRMHGFNLSVDDFGTGYSSLQQLSQYPFNEIKVDRVFVAKALTDTQHATIVDMAIQLAKKLQMKVVIEGVETHEQWHYMKRLGANICQGYFCAKPMLAQQLGAWHRAWQVQYQSLKKHSASTLNH